MRFLFVDRITERARDRIRGRFQLGGDEPWLARGLTGDFVVAPGIVSEAVGQLASWLTLEQGGFTARPVFLFADEIRIHAPVPAGAVVDLEATIDALDGESFRFSGTASVDGTVVQEISECSGYFMPLAELEDPEVTRARFRSLIEGGLTLSDREGPLYPFHALAGETRALEPGRSIVCVKRLSEAEPFYRDHFPRFPVTPIVILNEMIGKVAERCLGLDDGRRLAIKRVRGIKIKSFVRPGEEVETRVTFEDDLSTVAELRKEGRTILRGRYEFAVME